MNIFLKNKLYRLFTVSLAFGNAGRTLFDIAFIIYATSLPNPELAVSIVSIATSLPYIISFILGYFADQTKDKYNRILSTRFYQFLLFSLFALVCIYGVQWWIFIVLVFVNVVADILGGYNSYLSMSINTRLVRKEQLSEGLAFISSINNTISLAGKAVGVFVLGLLSYNYSYFGMLNAVLFLIAFLILAKYKNSMKDEIGTFKVKNKDFLNLAKYSMLNYALVSLHIRGQAGNSENNIPCSHFPFLDNSSEFSYYNLVFQDALDTLQIIELLFPNKDIYATGVGQGAAISLVCASYYNSIKELFISDCSLCDIKNTYIKNKKNPIFRKIYNFEIDFPDKIDYLYKTLDSIDILNISISISQKVHYGLSYLDPRTPINAQLKLLDSLQNVKIQHYLFLDYKKIFQHQFDDYILETLSNK